jgi:SAM-dependent methyltransferase
MSAHRPFTALGQADVAFQANLYAHPNPTRRWLHGARHQWVTTALERYSPPGGAQAFEVGVGCGTYTAALARRGLRVLAIDINASFLRAVEHLPGVTTLLADATGGLPFRGAALALCSEVLEHVPPDRSLLLLRSLHDALAPGGVLILTTPQAFSTMELTAGLLRFSPVLALARKLYGTVDELGHINLHTRRSLRRQLREAGFEIVQSDVLAFYLPVLAEFAGETGRKAAELLAALLRRLPLLSSLLWTQAYVLRRPA